LKRVQQLVDNRLRLAPEHMGDIGLRVAVWHKWLPDDDAKVVRVIDSLRTVRNVGENLGENGPMIFGADQTDVELADQKEHRRLAATAALVFILIHRLGVS